MKKILSGVLSIIILLLTIAPVMAYNFETNTLTVAINAEYVPFEYIENGEYKGFDIELMKYIGAQMKCNVEFVDMDFEQLLPSVNTGKVDCAISAITITEERKMVVKFSEPYLNYKYIHIENSIEDVSFESYGIAYYNNTLTSSLNNAIKAAINSGFINGLAAKYGITNYEYTYNADIANSYESEVKSTGSFYDVLTNHWAFECIEEMSNRGVLLGYPDGNFYPNNVVTRAEFAKIMCLAAGLVINPVANSSYYDILSTDWFAPYVETGKFYLSGYVSNGQKYYLPNNMALREDIAVALVKLKGYDTSIYDESILKTMFTDYQSISQDARKYVAVAVEKGLISGYDDNTFRGQSSITRAEAATLLWRAYQYGNDNKVFEKEEFEEVVPTPKPTIPPEMEEPEKETEELEDSEQKKLELSLDISKTKYTLESNESLKITVNVEHNIDGEYTPNVTGNTEIIDSSTIKNSKATTKNVYTTKKLEPGKYKLSFSVTDDTKTHTETVNITVNEPEPEYTYELKTVATGINNVNKMIEIDDGVAYFTERKNIMVLKNNYSEPDCIFSTDDLEFLGTSELTKSQLANTDSNIVGIGFNKNNNHIYALIEQSWAEPDTYYIYDVTAKSLYKTFEFEDIYGELQSWKFGIEVVRVDDSGYTLSFDDSEIYINGQLIVDNRLPLEGGAHMETGIFPPKGNSYVIEMGNKFYEVVNNKILYKNQRSGEWEKFDFYVPYSNSEFVASNDEYLLFASRDVLCLIDKNGDSSILCEFDDIDNADGKIIKLDAVERYKSVLMNDGAFYYWDANYKCIRQLSKLK